MPTWANPHVDKKAIEDLRRILPEDSFRQEIEAQFLVDSAGVFRGIRDCIRGELEQPVPGQSYVLGLDLARLKDFTCLVVMNRQTRHVVAFERFNQVDWASQYQKIIALARKYKAVVSADSTGIGDPIVEAIQGSGVRVIPYKIGSAMAKQHLIDSLRVGIEKGHVSFPLIPILIKELSSYEYQVSPSGVVKFSAPGGVHDDTVVALALANWIAATPEFRYSYHSVPGI